MLVCPVPIIENADLDATLAKVRAHVGLEPGARIVAAMSGGVDSTVVAALLKLAGYEVIGITLQLYDHGQALKKSGACCAGQDIQDARQASHTLGIPHYVFDYESRFRESVIDAFADSYLRGETPVPCIRCNQGVKFHDLLKAARDLGAQAMATGHYVDRLVTPTGIQMRRADDRDRDQSYFLFATTQAQLEYLRFPLSATPKPQVRDLARQLGLTIAMKPDSQDICFVPQGRYTTLIDRLRPQGRMKGPILHIDGRKLGDHEGISGFTIGQRRGLNIAVGDPLYVVRIEPDTHSVIVGPKSALRTQALDLSEVNWLGDEPDMETAARAGRAVLARVRSTQAPVPARLEMVESKIRVIFDQGEDGVAPGQACALYDPSDPDRILGGGFISQRQ